MYKKPEKKLDRQMLDRNQYPQFYIKKEDEAHVVRQLQTILNMQLARKISSKGLTAVRESVSQIVEEALAGPVDTSLSALPETIEIILMGAKKHPGLLESLTSVQKNCSKIVNHTINVLSLAAQYCFFENMPEDELKKTCLAALLHDVGMAGIDSQVVEKKDKLTEKEFAEYQSHSEKGYKMLLKYPEFDPVVARTALEHHERLDGKGYPKKTADICPEAQLISLIDCYEALKYQDKNFRKALKPYDAMQILKKEVVKGKFSKSVFIDLCSCLIK